MKKMLYGLKDRLISKFFCEEGHQGKQQHSPYCQGFPQGQVECEPPPVPRQCYYFNLALISL